MPKEEAPTEEYDSGPEIFSVPASATPSEASSSESIIPRIPRPTAMFRLLAMTPPDPPQPPGQEDLERRIPGYRRIVIPREPTLLEILKEVNGVESDDQVLSLRSVQLRVVADKVGLRRLDVLTPLLKTLILDGSALSSLRELGTGLIHVTELRVSRCGLKSLDGVLGLSRLKILHAASNRIVDVFPLAPLRHLRSLDLANNHIAEGSQVWPLSVCSKIEELFLRGNPAAMLASYRADVTTALPSLIVLDGCNIGADESGDHAASVDILTLDHVNEVTDDDEAAAAPHVIPPKNNEKGITCPKVKQRPFSADAAAGSSTSKVVLSPRPNTTPFTMTNHALEFSLSEHHSGSLLTSGAPVCGNIARSLKQKQKKQNLPDAIQSACQLISEDIPQPPVLNAWTEIKKSMGIDMDKIDPSSYRGEDPSKVLDRLEEIERETSERLSSIREEPHLLHDDGTVASLLSKITPVEKNEYLEDEFYDENDFDSDSEDIWKKVDEALKPFSKNLKLAMLCSKTIHGVGESSSTSKF